MPKAKFDWYSVDTSNWHLKTDIELSLEFNVDKSVIGYWRKKLNVLTQKEALRIERELKASEGLFWCGGCKAYHPADCFGKAINSPFGLRTECYEYRKTWREKNAESISKSKREDYILNREVILSRNLKHREKNRHKTRAHMRVRASGLKVQFVSLAGGCCQRCNYNEFVSGLEFHHVDPQAKIEAPVKAIISGDYLRAYNELDKCVMLCRNCHMAFHASAWIAEFVKREGLGWTIKK